MRGQNWRADDALRRWCAATDLPTGEETRTLSPGSLHTVRLVVVEVVGQVLLWERRGTGVVVAEKDPPLWVIEARPEGGNPRPPGPNALALTYT